MARLRYIFSQFQIHIMLIFWFTGCMHEHPYDIGNGLCQDELNNEGCSYDGGDCYGLEGRG